MLDSIITNNLATWRSPTTTHNRDGHQISNKIRLIAGDCIGVAHQTMQDQILLIYARLQLKIFLMVSSW